MAKGIINNVGSGGGGRLLIASFESQNRKSFVPGTELQFSSSIAVGEGYLVDGTVAPDASGQLVFSVLKVINSTPTIVSGNSTGNVNIGVDQVYFVKSTGKIAGSVTVSGGTLIVAGGGANGNISIAANSAIIANSGASIGGGAFEVQGGGRNAVVALQNCTVNGKFSTAGITFVNLGGNDFNGNVASIGDEYVNIVGNTISGGKDLTVTAVVDECLISNNTVTGTTTLDPKCQP